MKLIKCKKCGSTIMTDDTLLTNIHEEYTELSRTFKRAKGADKNLILQQMSFLKKMMTSIIHAYSQMEERKQVEYNELYLLKKHLVKNNIMSQSDLDKLQEEARKITKQKIAETEKKLNDLYGELENYFANRTKSDPTAWEAINGGR